MRESRLQNAVNTHLEFSRGFCHAVNEFILKKDAELRRKLTKLAMSHVEHQSAKGTMEFVITIYNEREVVEVGGQYEKNFSGSI